MNTLFEELVTTWFLNTSTFIHETYWSSEWNQVLFLFFWAVSFSSAVDCGWLCSPLLLILTVSFCGLVVIQPSIYFCLQSHALSRDRDTFSHLNISWCFTWVRIEMRGCDFHVYVCGACIYFSLSRGLFVFLQSFNDSSHSLTLFTSI